MKKMVIFNVGGALSSYAEFNNKKILIDLGSNSDFSPVDDFLIPLSQQGKFIKNTGSENSIGKYCVDQLFLSHLDKDHISDYEKFREKFNASYMTCPSDNLKQDDDFKVNIDLLGEENNLRNLVLQDMKSRDVNSPNDYNMSPSNPLVSIVDEISLHYIKPSDCENNEDLETEYPNNISLVLFFSVGDKTVLLPGDISKDAMEYLIENDARFEESLFNKGVDYLVAPHHGLQTSFSEHLFKTIGGNKTRLNIISEKPRKEDSDENRSDVDGRYYNSEYSTGDNSLNQNAVKTSMGHVIIDFATDETKIRQSSCIQDVVNEFIV